MVEVNQHQNKVLDSSVSGQKKDNSFLSVIVPVYNDERYLGGCLKSIFESDYPNFEVIVVNDASTDRSLDIAKSFSCRIVDLKINKGVGNARNKGAEAAKGEILVFFDSDVVIEKATLSNFAKAHQNSDIKICQCRISPHSLSPRFVPELLSASSKHYTDQIGSESTYIQSYAFSIDKSAFFEVGGFSPNFKSSGGEEFEIGPIIMQHGFKMFFDQSFHIQHNFETFLPRFKKLYRRSYIYGKLVLKRDFKPDKGLGTLSQGINSILSVMGIGFLAISLFFHPAIFLFFITIVAQEFIDLRYNILIARRKGIFFSIRAMPVSYLWYFAMGLGVIKAGLAHYFKKISSIFTQFSFFISKTPPYVIFFVTDKCNALCKHCFNWKKIQNPGLSNDLTIEEIQRISKNFGRIKYLTYSGGEPSLRKDIVDVTQVFYKNNHLEILNFITNGFATELLVSSVKGILRFCPDLYLTVSFSLDGIESQHDEIRNTPGGFKRLLASINEVKKLQKYYPNLKISVATVYSSFNKDNIFEIIDYVTKKLKVQMGLTYVRGNTFDKNAKEINLDTYAKASEMVRKINTENLKKTDILRAIDSLCAKLITKTIRQKKAQIPCLVGSKLIEIGNDGTIFPCEMLDVDFGSIRDYDYNVKNILKTKKVNDFLRNLKEGTCFCTWECAIKSNIVYSISKYPSLFLEWVRQLSGIKN